MLDKIKNIHPRIVISFIGLVYAILIIINPYKNIHYGDIGLMYVQVQDIIDSGYSKFSLSYKGESIDPEYKLFPYKKPFVGEVNQKHYFVFPPYFLLMNAILFQLLGNDGLFVLNFLAFLLTLFLIYKLGSQFELDNFFINFSIVLYVFGMTSSNYNFVFHELPFSILWITLSIYFSFLYLRDKRNLHLLLFGFFGAISLFFRLEMVFIIVACGVTLQLALRNNFWQILKFSIIGFIFPFSIFIFFNYQIYDNPFGLRYSLNLTEASGLSLRDKVQIIYDLLFLKARGLFYQSPFTVILFLFPFFYKSLSEKDITGSWSLTFVNRKTFSKTRSKKNEEPRQKFLFIVISLSLLFILITSPNNGGHISPRYLFGVYPILSIFSVTCYKFILEYFISLREKRLDSFFYRNLALSFKILFFWLVGFSFFFTYQNYQWLKKSSANVSLFNSKLQSLADKSPIVFRDYSQPLNAQSLYLNQMTFTLEDLNGLSLLLQKFKSANIGKVLVSQVFSAALDDRSRSMAEEVYVKHLELSQKEDRYYLPEGKMYVTFSWIDLGKNQNLLVLNIFLQ